MPLKTDALSIWYLSTVRRCNFRCAYCVSGQPLIKDQKQWPNESDRKTHFEIMNWIGSLEKKVKLRISTVGEPFASDEFMDSVANLSHSKNIQYIELLTNASFFPKKLEKFVSESASRKIRLWLTFHPTQIGIDKFMASVELAIKLGVAIVCHGLIFPDTIAAMKELKGRCESIGVPVHFGLGLNFNNAYPDHGSVPIDQFGYSDDVVMLNTSFPKEVYDAAERPKGKKCAAGLDYVYVRSNGDVYPCRTYSLLKEMKPLGSVKDPNFKLKLSKKMEMCKSRLSCVCTEDHQNLQIAKEIYKPTSKSFVLWSKKQIRKSRVMKAQDEKV